MKTPPPLETWMIIGHFALRAASKTALHVEELWYIRQEENQTHENLRFSKRQTENDPPNEQQTTAKKINNTGDQRRLVEKPGACHRALFNAKAGLRLAKGTLEIATRQESR
jgi:hypothetical protein